MFDLFLNISNNMFWEKIGKFGKNNFPKNKKFADEVSSFSWVLRFSASAGHSHERCSVRESSDVVPETVEVERGRKSRGAPVPGVHVDRSITRWGDASEVGWNFVSVSIGRYTVRWGYESLTERRVQIDESYWGRNGTARFVAKMTRWIFEKK